MKKRNFVLLFIAAAFMMLCFTQCHKERSCGATVTCMYHPDPSVVAPVTNVTIDIDRLGKYNHEFMNITEMIIGDSVQYDTTYFTRPISDTLQHLFPHTTQDPDLLYIGYTQITLEEGVLDKHDTIWLEPEN